MDFTQLPKEWNHAICRNMEGPRDYHNKWGQTEKNKYHITSYFKKMIQMNLFIKQKYSQTQETNLRLPKGKGGGIN